VILPPKRLILIAGWNEQSKMMRTFIDGRNGFDGLAAFGFDCTIFPDGNEYLRERVDRFRAFLDRLHAREPDAFPVATLGYSAGGLINRGFLRAYPERAGEIAASVQVAAPNGGLITNYAVGTMRLARVPTHVLADMDVTAPFMTWLNDTPGHWVPDPDNPKKQRWRLDKKPWVMPEGHRFMHVVGRMPKYDYQSDGVVMIESANLDGAMPVVTIDQDEANHLNLGAVSNIFATIFRRFKHDDAVWPQVVELTARFLRGEHLP
jgi:pimeloyl-ACP methyl ester carboxylesterase